MIKTFRNAATRRFAETGKGRFGGMDVDKARVLLAHLNAAAALSDISPLKSVGLHPLKGVRKGQWAMTVNGSWRTCFRFRAGDAFDVEIVDYH